MPAIRSFLSDLTADAVTAKEADLNYSTRTMLDAVCASVENAAEDFAADAAMLREFGEDDS